VIGNASALTPGKDSAREIREYFIPELTDWKTDRDAKRNAFERLLTDLRSLPLIERR
jgi:hypothetical protein